MLHEGSLVLYKSRPARVRSAGEKLEIELDDGETSKTVTLLRVRPKDVTLLHPGPLRSLAELRPQGGEVEAAWELLAGGTTTLPELAELAFGSYTPVTAWAAWQLVSEGLYFRGDAEKVTACTPEEVAQKRAARAAEAAEKRAWEAFLAHARAGQTAAEDGRYLKEIEALALGRSTRSRALRELGREETPASAHALLLDLGHWTPAVNPYPVRLGLLTTPPAADLPPLPAERREARLDLTHLPAFAIDDEGTETPDDALSLADNRLWVHVADAASLVAPGSAADLEARARGATLHLPEGIVPMLPPEATPRLGLGLAKFSPALSFGLDLDPDEQVVGLEIVPSWVRVTRLTYEEAEAQIEAEPFASLYRLAQVNRARRQANGALNVELPEVKIRVRDGQVVIRPLPPLCSRNLVEEAMIVTGEAVARFAIERGIPLPFATQDPPDTAVPFEPERLTLAGMFALRRTLKRSQYRGSPAPHAGLGLSAYSQATSPLRRYLDLVVHQQLRAYLRGEGLLSSQEVLERIGAVEAVIGSLRQGEQLSNVHWTLVYLLQHPGWRGEGVLVNKRGLSGTVLIPDLAYEVPLHLPADLPLDSRLRLTLRRVDLAQQIAHFRVEG
jgi:exoribonuclease-2